MGLYTKIIDLQKLGEAWRKVKANKPASGVDGISYEEYDSNIRENLKQLHIELAEHRYEPLPVKQVNIYKGEKKRTISLFSMRDKVVQQSIAAELSKLFDCEMSECTYAYRPGKAALQAIEYLEKEVVKSELKWVLKADIRNFFDCVLHNKLYEALKTKIWDRDVLNLIKMCCEVKELQDDGYLREKNVGIAQGSSMAPVLSNIYLKTFDFEMQEKCKVFLRYSDDIIILGENEEQMINIKSHMAAKLTMLGLCLNEEKTKITPLAEGITFLGYTLSKSGKSIPAAVEKNLNERLEDIWLTSKGEIDDKLRKSAEILMGWEQYYRDEREIQSIQEYAAVVYMVCRKNPEVLEKIRKKRRMFRNIYKEICIYLVSIWEKMKDWQAVLFEYEQIYELDGADPEELVDDPEAICSCYHELMSMETEETWSDLMQMYSDCGSYNKASKIMEFIARCSGSREADYSKEVLESANDSKGKTFIDPEFVELYLKTFAGREDVYGKEELNYSKKRTVEQVAEPLTEDVIKQHLEGKITAHTYVQRSNYTVKYLIIDIDISKRAFLQESESDVFQQYLSKAAAAAEDILKVLDKNGLKGYLENSGYRGFHIWVFFTEWIPVRYVSMLTDIIEMQREKSETDISVEYFPNKSKLRNGSLGQSIKLPLGVHVYSAKRSAFLNRDFRSIEMGKTFLKDIAQFSLLAVKRIIACNNNSEQEIGVKEVDTNLEMFGELPDNVRVVLANCNLVRYLCQKAKTTGYLSHFERLSILYVLGHLGEEGKNFVHTVMGFTLNYQYHVTEKFIQKLPAKPISCIKLREQYKQITAEYGCSCNFKRTKDCYPSPVLHAIKSSEDVAGDITIPTSRTLTKANEKKVIEEINIHKKVQELAGKIIEMKKQKRGIDKVIQKTENELERIYDQAGIDCLEVDMGLLVRRKKEQGYEWLIEI